jgi:hypothetical protein
MQPHKPMELITSKDTQELHAASYWQAVDRSDGQTYYEHVITHSMTWVMPGESRRALSGIVDDCCSGEELEGGKWRVGVWYLCL